MKFIDIAEIKVKAGDGGAGMSHFRREKYVPFGGPDGGDGGDGGQVFLEGDAGLSTLLDFRYRRIHEALSGKPGGTNNRTGRRGKDCVLRVPCGTLVRDSETNEIIGEVLTDSQRLLVAKGGRGGIGNGGFATSQNQAPTRTIPCSHGERRSLILELKMIADVGIIGAPNAGKSTLVTVISAARPKVADYPFTTLVPSLGVVSHKEAPPFVVADVPGLIPGASQGKGLGHEFLRHIERTRILLHLIDGSQDSADAMIEDFLAILKELSEYRQDLLERPRITVISKIDRAHDSENPEQHTEALTTFARYLESQQIQHLMISAAERQGISTLLDATIELLAKLPQEKAE